MSRGGCAVILRVIWASLGVLSALALAPSGWGLARAMGAPAMDVSTDLQADVRGEIGGFVVHHHVDAGAPQLLGVLESRVEARMDPKGPVAAFPEWWAEATAEPRWVLDLTKAGGKTEASVVWTRGLAGFRFPAVDLYVGRFGLPLETARLTLPYTLTPPDEAGRRPGADGIRADVYLKAGRLQLVGAWDGEAWTPVVGWRRAALGWELTGHLLRSESGLVAGAGWSGLAGSTVVYGEGWRVAGEAGIRFSVGATGYVGDLLWTAEVARAPFNPASGSATSRQAPRPLVAVQLAHAPLPGLTIVADASAGLGGGKAEVGGHDGSGGEPRAAGSLRPYRWGIVISRELMPGVSALEFAAHRVAPVSYPAVFSASLGLRYFF